MKSSNELFLLLLAMVICFLAGCSSTYYNRFGGYTLDSQEFSIQEGTTEIKLLVNYRYPYQNGAYDSTNLNISVKTIIPLAALSRLSVNRLVLASADSSYLYTYNNPAIYDKFGKYPIRSNQEKDEYGSMVTSSDQICLFTVSRSKTNYIFTLYYRIKSSDDDWLDVQKSFPINISDIKIKIRKDAADYLYE